MEQKIKVLKKSSKFYPERLKNIPYPPEKLFVKTGLTQIKLEKLFLSPAVAVVGSRKMSSYGRNMAEKLTTDLVKAGVTIISGMALGIDGVAHRAAIKNNGKTIAVLGSGIDLIYPTQNSDIYNLLANEKYGAVVSEFCGKTPPEAKNFPLRNRIIAGLSSAVLVVEAAEKSGTLITASWAADQGKDVFAVPCPVGISNFKGTNWLLNQGAKAVSCASEILEDLK